MVYRACALIISERTALVNQIRGLLGEFGIVVPVGIAQIRRALPRIFEDTEHVPSWDWYVCSLIPIPMIKIMIAKKKKEDNKCVKNKK